jgi:hypothetical protein
MIFVRPYISAIDQRVETVALLALGGVAHVASLFTLGAGRNRYGGQGVHLNPCASPYAPPYRLDGVF